MEYNILTVFKQSCTLWSMKVFKAFHELTKPEQKEREMLKVFSLPARSTGQASYCPLRKAHLEPKETLLRSPDLSLLSLGSWCFVRCEQSACRYRNCEDSITSHLDTPRADPVGGWGTKDHTRTPVWNHSWIQSAAKEAGTHSSVLNLQEYTFADVLSLM